MIFFLKRMQMYIVHTEPCTHTPLQFRHIDKQEHTHKPTRKWIYAVNSRKLKTEDCMNAEWLDSRVIEME